MLNDFKTLERLSSLLIGEICVSLFSVLFRFFTASSCTFALCASALTRPSSRKKLVVTSLTCSKRLSLWSPPPPLLSVWEFMSPSERNGRGKMVNITKGLLTYTILSNSRQTSLRKTATIDKSSPLIDQYLKHQVKAWLFWKMWCPFVVCNLPENLTRKTVVLLFVAVHSAFQSVGAPESAYTWS